MVEEERYVFEKYFYGLFGVDKKVNDISNKEFELYVDYRMRLCRRKETIRQELTISYSLYKNLLLKKGYVFKLPEMPEFKVRKKGSGKER